MNIKITYNWLLEYLDTDADAYEMQKYLSLCGPGVERVEKLGDDYVMEIEITTNRIDMASVVGIAQEAQAILPLFGKRAVLKSDPLMALRFSQIKDPQRLLPFECAWRDKGLATRTCFLVLNNATYASSPDYMQRRLAACDVRPLGNLIDVTNYIMIALGQPAHVFDYDKIKGNKLILRHAQKGEQITTLDNKTYTLPGQDIVMEDGDGRLVDLCGIMGAANSAVEQNTKRVVLFTQTYNKRHIRRTSMATSARSVAATYFEKGLDEQRAQPALVYGAKLLMELCGASIASSVIDQYPHPQSAQSVSVSHEFIVNRIGIDIPLKLCVQILTNLGFDVVEREHVLKVTPPPHRQQDIEIPEDIVEEIARIYGYHNLPNHLPPAVHITQPEQMRALITQTSRIKHYLSHLGLHEQMNYSMISKALVEGIDLDPGNHLKLKDDFSSELQYMRISLIPSLLNNVQENYGKRDVLRFFEVAKVYYPQAGDLPKEVWKLGIAVNTSFEDLKGIIEALLKHLKTPSPVVTKADVAFFAPHQQANFLINEAVVGSMGALKQAYQHKLGLKQKVCVASIDILSLVENANKVHTFKPINPYAIIKRDLTIAKTGKTYQQIVDACKKQSMYLDRVEYVGSYEANISIRLHFTSTTDNITEDVVNEQMHLIQQSL